MEKIRILYAEDYELVLFTAKQLLEAEGWEVEVCRDAAAAVKRLEGEGHFDLLILDDRLGGVSGAELIERARRSRRLSATPIILFTAVEANGGSTSRGADARLNKPAGLKDLVPTCRRLLPHAAVGGGVELQAAGSNGRAARSNGAGD